MLKTVELYWFNGLDTKVYFYNDTLEEKNFMGSVAANTPIKLSVDIRTYTSLVLKQVSQDKILVSSVDMSVELDDENEGVQ